MSQTTIRYCPYAILSAGLIRKLYGLDDSLSTRKLTLSEIQKLTGAPWKYIKQAVTDPTSIVSGKCPCRYCPDKELNQLEIEFLCSDATL